MRRALRNQLLKMSTVYLFVVALAIWQFKFVKLGLAANVYLNGGILAVFVFGAFLTMRQIIGLYREVTALDALKEAYEDARIKSSPQHTDPYWRHYRALKPGRVYYKPHTLGHFFELTLDEILRTRKLRITIGTLRDIVHGIEERIHEERSFIAYLTGLLIFMGLIGTFMGLMKMVASVSDIIGSLATPEGGGGGGGGFNELLTQLQHPLQGMAIGFSCSLFGLFTSLTLGLAAKFGNAAALALKNEFEGWLSSAAQIENEDEDGRSGSASGTASKGHSAGGGVSKEALAQLVARTEHGLGKVATAMQEMARAQADQTEVLREASRGLERMATHNEAMSKSLHDLGETTRSGLAGATAAIGKAEQTSIAVARGLATRQADAANRLMAAINKQASSEDLRALASRISADSAGSPAAALPIDAASVDEVRAMARSIESGMNQGFDSVARSIEATLAQWASVRVEEPVAVNNEIPIPVTPEEAPVMIDHDEMVRRLRSAVAEKFAATGTNG